MESSDLSWIPSLKGPGMNQGPMSVRQGKGRQDLISDG